MAVLGDLLLRRQGDFDDVMGTTVWNFAVGVALRDVVFVSSADTVDKISATGSGEDPAIGVVVALNTPSAGQCVVRHVGLVTGFSGLTAGRRYILSRASGEILESTDSGNPDYPVVGDFKQTIGVAANTTTLMVMVDSTTYNITA